jgi:hypothetical protein
LGKEETNSLKVKLVMAGQCPKCGKEYQRKPPVDAAACMCGNPDAVLVPLQPTLIVSVRTYRKLNRIAELANIALEDFVSELLTDAARKKLEELQSFPNMIVTVKGV